MLVFRTVEVLKDNFDEMFVQENKSKMFSWPFEVVEGEELIDHIDMSYPSLSQSNERRGR